MILVDGNMVAERFCAGAATWQYFVTDHLGSVATATDATGLAAAPHTEHDAYDPWSRHRAATGADDPACGTAPQSVTSCGYTGHEMINDVCLINANARVYDPTLGRFMTPDTMVSDATNLQDWNPYTYVNNRPLTLVDPTGHFQGPAGSSGQAGDWWNDSAHSQFEFDHKSYFVLSDKFQSLLPGDALEAIIR